MSESDSRPDAAPSYSGPTIPEPLGEQLRLALGLDQRPAVFGDWVDALAFIAERDDLDVDLDLLCTTEDSPHRATFDGRTEHYQCVLDAVMVPFLAADVDAVDIETRSPIRDEPVELTVTESDLTATPADAVMSFGVAADATEPAADLPSPILAYGRFCPYGKAFPTREEYEEWAADVDALTMAVSMEDTFELARALGRVA